MQTLTIPLPDDLASPLEELAAELGFTDTRELVWYLAVRAVKADPADRDKFMFDRLFEQAAAIGERERARLVESGKGPPLRLVD